MKVTVYHNLSRDASSGLNTVFEADHTAARGYVKRQARTEAEQHELVKVFEYEEADVPAVLEVVFHKFNVGTDSDAQAYRARRLRSLSVGDVVKLEEDHHLAYYSVESLGFKRRNGSELRFVTDLAEAERLVRERYEFTGREELAVTVPLA